MSASGPLGDDVWFEKEWQYKKKDEYVLQTKFSVFVGKKT
jgi:hypothetical protein